jgi:ribosome-binding ATPase YchF (GTP1/OBG family)
LFIGVVGKPNAGKSTFFAGATLVDAKIAPFPFTTIEPNKGKAYVRVECPCKNLGVKCRPKNSLCVDGVRLIPIETVDVAGLVPDAHLGRGLGLKFLDDLRAADALIQVVDSSGKTDLEGKDCLGCDPSEEIRFLVKEIEYWIADIIKRNMMKIKGRGADEVTTALTGLKITRSHVEVAANKASVPLEKINWNDEETLSFSKQIRAISKPIAFAANKVDSLEGRKNFEKMRKEFPGMLIVSTCAEAELALRRANEKGLVKYVPGAPDFEVLGGEPKQREALEKIRAIVKENGGTGVQQLIDRVVFELLDLIVVYPVEDEHKFSDHFGNVLPDGYLLKKGSNCHALAEKIHTDLAKKFICGIDARTHMRVGKDHVLQNGDVIKIVANR